MNSSLLFLLLHFFSCSSIKIQIIFAQSDKLEFVHVSKILLGLEHSCKSYLFLVEKLVTPENEATWAFLTDKIQTDLNRSTVLIKFTSLHKLFSSDSKLTD